ncbi:unnamed protein product [Adineta steineri]|uniref:F-box domain-containing protein n=1 Tax=Adineta steineri TaxID=433720 RepID=A0A814QJH7_9BILA|nr:unnamed protein product [Adineta steineri]CAF1649842.1 unnamed protein product [Adineta steineri]
MEYLPDELFLIIFCYLSKLDIVCTFNNLNHRFQQLTSPYLFNIDFTQKNNINYRTIYSFINEILPSQGHQIRILTLQIGQQQRLFQSHIHQLTNLTCLTLKSDEAYKLNSTDELYQFLANILSLKTLNKLSISKGRKALKAITTFASRNLTHLILLQSRDLSYLNCNSTMPFIKRLSVNLTFETIPKLFQIMTNLKELKLILYIKYCFHYHCRNLKVPETLEKLHLEFKNRSRYLYSPYRIQEIVDLFKNNLKCMTLICGPFPNEYRKYYDELQSFVNSFIRIENFQYHIRTTHQPDIRFSNIKKCFDSYFCFGTFPQSNICDSISSRTTSEFSLWPDRTPEELLTCSKLYITRNRHLPSILLSKFESRNDLRLLNLNEIRFHHNIEDIPSTTLQLLSKLITLSPNLQTLFIMSSCTQKMIQYLKQIFSN